MTATTGRALLQCFRPTVDAVAADLAAVARQHGASDPEGVARRILRDHAGPLATVLARLRSKAAEAAVARDGG